MPTTHIRWTNKSLPIGLCWFGFSPRILIDARRFWWSLKRRLLEYSHPQNARFSAPNVWRFARRFGLAHVECLYIHINKTTIAMHNGNMNADHWATQRSSFCHFRRPSPLLPSEQPLYTKDTRTHLRTSTMVLWNSHLPPEFRAPEVVNHDVVDNVDAVEDIPRNAHTHSLSFSLYNMQ